MPSDAHTSGVNNYPKMWEQRSDADLSYAVLFQQQGRRAFETIAENNVFVNIKWR
jgi:hypothetical protein